jgi:Ca2+-binding RTX toxin-like protein
VITRLAAILAVLVATVGVGLFGLNQASAGDPGARFTMKRYVCHPVNGNGNQGNGWNLIKPAAASSHIDESLYPDGHYWKHTSRDGRHDVYADGQTCPGGTQPPSPCPSVTVTATVTITPAAKTQTTPTSCPTATTTVTVTATPTSPSQTPTVPTTPPPPPPVACPPTGFNRIFGSHKGDTLRGTVCRDIILGHGGNDRLFAVGAGDVLIGGRGDDVLHAGTGRTVLRGGMGTDTCFTNPGDLIISCERIR